MDDPARFPRVILATCCVPWNAKYELDEEIFRDTVGGLVSAGFRDLYVFGTAGEGYAVDEVLFDQVVDAFVDETQRHRVPPMVGVISLSLRTIIGRIERCIARGIHLFQIALPAWGALNDSELRSFFVETCERFPEAQFLHYNLGRTKRLISVDEYAELADRHPNLVAIKHPVLPEPEVRDLYRRVRTIRHFFTEPAYSYASLAGPCGFLVSTASLNPEAARTYFEAGVQADKKALAALAQELKEISVAMKQAVGAGPHMDAAFDKIFNKVHNRGFPLRLLPPYEGTTDEAFTGFEATLRERFPRWCAAPSK